MEKQDITDQLVKFNRNEDRALQKPIIINYHSYCNNCSNKSITIFVLIIGLIIEISPNFCSFDFQKKIKKHKR